MYNPNFKKFNLYFPVLSIIHLVIQDFFSINSLTIYIIIFLFSSDHHCVAVAAVPATTAAARPGLLPDIDPALQIDTGINISRTQVLLGLGSRFLTSEPAPLENKKQDACDGAGAAPIKKHGSRSSWKINSIRKLIIYYFSLAKIGRFNGFKKFVSLFYYFFSFTLTVCCEKIFFQIDQKSRGDFSSRSR